MIECICLDNENGPEFYRNKTVKARKTHVCCECGKPIQVGDRHEIAVGKWDGTFDQFRTCCFCSKICDLLFSCGHSYGQMYENLYEQFGDDMKYMFEGYDIEN